MLTVLSYVKYRGESVLVVQVKYVNIISDGIIIAVLFGTA